MTGFRYLFVWLLSPLSNNQQLTNKNLFQVGFNSIDLKGSPRTGILTSSLGNYEWQVVPKNYFVPLCTNIFTWELSPEQHFWMWLTPSCSWKWVASTGKPSAAHSPTPSQELASSPFPLPSGLPSLENLPHWMVFLRSPPEEQSPWGHRHPFG